MSAVLTDKLVRELVPPDRGHTIMWDSQVRGFGIRTTKAGAKSWVVFYRNQDARQRLLTLGSWPNWSAKQARMRAMELKRQVDQGADPAQEKQDRRAAPSMSDLCNQFIAEHVPSLRPHTQRGYIGIIENVIRPELGDRKVAAITIDDARKLHQGIVGGKLTKKGKPANRYANLSIAVLSAMFSLAIEKKLRTDNPTLGIKKAPEVARDRYLTEAEFVRLSAALDRLEPEHDVEVAAIRLLMLTGARVGETLQSKWSDFNLEAGVWSKPASTTKAARVHRVPYRELQLNCWLR